MGYIMEKSLVRELCALETAISSQAQFFLRGGYGRQAKMSWYCDSMNAVMLNRGISVVSAMLYA